MSISAKKHTFEASKQDYLMMKKALFSLFALMTALLMAGQELPQFGPSDYDGWNYNNPNIALNPTSISSGQIALYVTSQGKALTLTSPLFQCEGITGIEALVNWNTKNFYSSNFDLSRTALTMVIDDGDGNPVDSVTCLPSTPGVSTHKLTLTLTMPQGLASARIRFVSWQANVDSFGAIRQVTFTATTSGNEGLAGDVNGNGSLDIGDVTGLIDYLLASNQATIDPAITDVNNDGVTNIGDITSLIDKLLTQ